MQKLKCVWLLLFFDRYLLAHKVHHSQDTYHNPSRNDEHTITTQFVDFVRSIVQSFFSHGVKRDVSTLLDLHDHETEDDHGGHHQQNIC